MPNSEIVLEGPIVQFEDRDPIVLADCVSAANRILVRAGSAAVAFDTEGRCFVATEIAVTKWQRASKSDIASAGGRQEIEAAILTALSELANEVGREGPSEFCVFDSVPVAEGIVAAFRRQQALTPGVEAAVRSVEAAIALANSRRAQ